MMKYLLYYQNIYEIFTLFFTGFFTVICYNASIEKKEPPYEEPLVQTV